LAVDTALRKTGFLAAAKVRLCGPPKAMTGGGQPLQKCDRLPGASLESSGIGHNDMVCLDFEMKCVHCSHHVEAVAPVSHQGR
jgi:hypothetical protein